ncbi:hypothetical protein IMZ48_34685 [Candidatus Bathyarchaeota archaeon]|nr:hypothetical protein [Candidatus Bathyarchaeota archaeon]
MHPNVSDPNSSAAPQAANTLLQNEGHKRMAYVFYAAIHNALIDDKVVDPAPLENEDDNGCEKTFGSGTSAGKNPGAPDIQRSWSMACKMLTAEGNTQKGFGPV